jgi:DNA (cytosine-5)-methyltransferase 1
MIKYGSVCSGVEAATVAWHHLGWKPQFFSEIEAFPSAVLEHHYPDVPNYGDMTKFKEWNNDSIDLLVGGTPCQSFSIAGLRKGLDDPRGNLMLTYLAIVERFSPKWVVWENVPGVLSSKRGRDFGTFIGALGKLGYGFAYRVLDAQYFGVPQRRRRVFVVGCLGDWRSAAAVLFERESMSRNIAPSKKTREEVAGTVTTRVGSGGGGGLGTDEACSGFLQPTLAGPLTAGMSKGPRGTEAVESNHIITTEWPAKTAATLNAAFGSKHGLEDQHINGGASWFVPDKPIAFPAEMSGTQAASAKDVSPALAAKHTTAVAEKGMRVRRLTPRETERLQGFPDDYTRIPWRKKDAENCPDGPRYKAMGNSMAVPVMRWIGERIQKFEEIKNG